MFLLRLAEKGFTVLALLLSSDAIFDLLNQGSGESSPIARALFYVVQAGTILLLVVWWKRVVRIVIKEKLLWILVTLLLASVIWSVAPGVTISRNMALLRVTLFGVYFATRYSVKEQLRLLAWMFGIAALLSLAFGLALPSYGIMGRGSVMNAENLVHAGAWQGIYTHKNVLGRIMVLSATVFLLLAGSLRRYRWVIWGGFGLSFLLILLSTSKSSLVIFLTIMILLPLFRALRWNYSVVLPLFISVILVGGGVATLLVSNAEAILGAMGKDITLTGRTDIWAVSLEKIWQSPWLGYGYAGFWRGMDGESADIWLALKWEVPHAHNGFVDLGLDLGLVGLTVFLLTFVTAYLRGVTWVRLLKTGEGLLPLAYLTFLILSNLTESSLVKPNIFWTLYVVTILSMHNRSHLADVKALWRQKVKGGMKQINP